MGHCGYFSVRQPNNGVPTTTSRTSEGIHYIIWNFAGFGFVSNCLQLPCIRSKNSSNHSLRWLNILMWLITIRSWQPEWIIFLRSYSSWRTCLSQRRPPLSQRPSPFHLISQCPLPTTNYLHSYSHYSQKLWYVQFKSPNPTYICHHTSTTYFSCNLSSGNANWKVI